MHISGNDLQINLGDVTITYDDQGAGDKTLIFIHGFPFDKSCWQPQIAYFRLKYRVIAFDIRGFGRSDYEGDPVSIPWFADDLVKFMDKLNIEKAFVCGLSMGGYILLNAVSRYPERFEAIILNDTQCIADSDEAREKRYQSIAQIEENGLEEFTDGFLKKAFCAETFENCKEVVDRTREVILRTSVRTVTGGLKALAQRDDTCRHLSNIQIPVLIICGKHDELTPVTQSEFMHKNIKKSDLVIIDGAGHLPNLEQGKLFDEAVEAFINQLY